MINTQKSKIIVILGPTSSGKSSVAIKLARKFNGEIISADSRQIYRGMDVGTGKVTKAEQALARHHMLDIISPKTNFSSAQFKKKAEKIIQDVLKRGNLPIICGGTGFWIKAIVSDVVYPEVKPDWKLREKLGKKSAEELFAKLKKLDPVRAKNIDAKNPVRLIRAIEICKILGSVPTINKQSASSTNEFLQIGIAISKEKLQQHIEKRLKQRFRKGMIAEVASLHKEQRISWKKIESFGLGYFWIAKFLQKQLPMKELFEKVYQTEKDYAKRQMTWFKKDERIVWLDKYQTIQNEVNQYITD
ncbi:MAG: tRNA (adenosine(37)-N6)-dimethylallyltransferase MiaA [Candidatus Moraniibacteriota bacterium]|jgi:tRNA dimethylallyltransferase